MKSLPILTLFFSFLITVQAQQRPFGTIKTTDGKYMDETEVDLGSWLSFYSWVLNHQGKEAARFVLPDSTAVLPQVWEYLKNQTNTFSKTLCRYSMHPLGYFNEKCPVMSDGNLSRSACPLLDYPVTGVSYQQVVWFCQWRSIISEVPDLEYRLPSIEEWIAFAEIGFTEKEKTQGYRDSVNKKQCPNFNFQMKCECGYDKFQGKLNAIGQYTAEDSRAFDIFGNVSEMTITDGIAKGGNYLLYALQCHPDSVQHYSRPEKWLGFRCIAQKKATNQADCLPTTFSIPMPPDPTGKTGILSDPRDKKKYRTVKIANQVWMAENLAFKPDSGKYWAYNNDLRSVSRFGYLYNWETAKQVCPAGWHLPSKDEFTTLVNQFGGLGTSAYNHLIPTGKSGFMMLESGLRYGSNFVPIVDRTAFWTSTSFEKRKSWAIIMYTPKQNLEFYNSFNLNYGLQVRCVKDE